MKKNDARKANLAEIFAAQPSFPQEGLALRVLFFGLGFECDSLLEVEVGSPHNEFMKLLC